MKVIVTFLLLFALIMPITQIGVVNGQRGIPNPPPRPPVVPNPLPTARPTANLPTARPTVNLPTAQPTMIQPTVTIPTRSFSFTQTLPTSFSFTMPTITTTFTSASFSFNPTFTFVTTTTGYGNDWWYVTGGYWYPGMGFFHYGASYSSSTGSFTLGRTLTDQNDRPCLYYDYFQFDAPAGLSVTAQVWTEGPQVTYLILPVSVLYENPGTCGSNANIIPNILQSQTFGSTPYNLNWTSPQDDQYIIVFYSRAPYSGLVYFLPQ